MSDYYDARKECPALRRATKAFVTSILDEMLPQMRVIAGNCGYALAVHGTLSRDIDMVAVPWVAHNVAEPDVLVDRLCTVVASFAGYCHRSKDWGEKPHGRRAVTLIAGGMCPEIDLSVMPKIERENA